VDELAAEVAGASQEQTRGITHINSAVAQMDKVTKANAGNARESAVAAEELNAQAASMKQSVAELLQLVGGHGQRTVAQNTGEHAGRATPAVRQNPAPGKRPLSPARVCEDADSQWRGRNSHEWRFQGFLTEACRAGGHNPFGIAKPVACAISKMRVRCSEDGRTPPMSVPRLWQ